MIPAFQSSGLLPAGIHPADWSDIGARFGGSAHRDWLLAGLLKALTMLRDSGCTTVYLDGSFVTEKEHPSDYDALWDPTGVDPKRVDPVLLDFSDLRLKQKLKYRGEFFPANATVDPVGITFLAFFQVCKVTGAPKGLVRIELSSLP